MTSRDILQLRLNNQQLNGSVFANPHELVQYMGCMQAQDFYGAKWAIGTRVKGTTDALIEKEFTDGKILRTHVLRPTWHFVSPEDIRWMLQLSAPRIKALGLSHHKQLGIDNDTLNRTKKALEIALSGGKQLTRDELIPHLIKNKVTTNDNRISFLLIDAELDGLICSGARKGKQFTYTLLEERIPKSNSLYKDEAIAALGKRYFTSRGPATAHDFSWWSGMNLTDAKKGIELNRAILDHVVIRGQNYWFAADNPVNLRSVNGLYLLPAFDEYAIAYKDRSLSIKPEHSIKTLNGIFKPTLIINTRVAGLWSRIEKKDKVVVQVEPFIKLSAPSVKKITIMAKRYGKFLGRTSEVIVRP